MRVNASLDLSRVVSILGGGRDDDGRRGFQSGAARGKNRRERSEVTHSVAHPQSTDEMKPAGRPSPHSR